jgi:ectoine hydroxylase-related dioxygenase (phytanoyl-CoA dioxygenase family)
MSTALAQEPVVARAQAREAAQREDWLARLARLGVHDAVLTQQERDCIDENGFVILHDMGDADYLAAVRLRYEEQMKRENAGDIVKSDFSTEHHREAGARRLADMVNKGEVFDRAWLHPRVLAVVAHVLKRPFKLSALSARDALPGSGHQGLHADWGPHADGEGYHVVNCIWAVDGFNPANGGPRLVPGSHRFVGGVGDQMKDAAAPHPQQIVPVVPPGSVLAMNAHTWHGGTNNIDGSPRRAMHAYFCGREHSQQLNQAEYLRVKTAERIGADGRWLLDA